MGDKVLYTCCFIGHRTIQETEELKWRLRQTIERLIVEEKVDTFLFGSKSRFDALCLETVTQLKEKYPHIRRVYVRAEYPRIDEAYKKYLSEFYEDTYYPASVQGAGQAVYVKRTYDMITNSRFCVFYYDRDYEVPTRKSGTQLAMAYAIKQKKHIISMLEENNS